jgi:hypothetical protein
MARELGADGNPLACIGEAILGRQRGDLAHARERYAEALRLLNAQIKPDWTSAALAGLASVPELAQELDRLRLGVIDDSDLKEGLRRRRINGHGRERRGIYRSAAGGWCSPNVDP